MGKHFGRGYCRTHYERWKRNGDVELRKDSSRPCVVDGCERTHFGKGMCRPHYRRFMKYGDPVVPAPSQRTDTYERWLSYVNKTDTCWLWTGGLWETGYGRFWVGDKTVLVHRWSYEHHVGPIPKGKHLDHLCRVRNCVRPDHLEPVTARENLMRGKTTQAAVNAAKTHCPQGHPYDEVNTYRDKKGRRSCITCRRDSDARRRSA